MCAPRSKAGVFHYDPIAFLKRFVAQRGAQRLDLETAFVSADGGGGGCAEGGGERRAGGVHALDLVYVGGVYGGGEGSEEEGGGRKGRGD